MIRTISILLMFVSVGCVTYIPKDVDLYKKYLRLAEAVKESRIEKNMKNFYTASYTLKKLI